MYRICCNLVGYYIFVMILMICNYFYPISAYDLSITYVVLNAGDVYLDGTVQPLSQTVDGKLVMSTTIVGHEPHVLAFHLRSIGFFGGFFLCYWNIPELNISGYTGNDWYYYTSANNLSSWMSTTSLEYTGTVKTTNVLSYYNWNYPGQWISTPTYGKGAFKTIIDLTTLNPTSSPSLAPTPPTTRRPSLAPVTKAPTLPVTRDPTRTPTPPTRSPTPRPVQGDISSHVVVKYDLSCDDDSCISNVLDKSIQITETYLNKNIALENNANFDKSVKNKNISIGLNSEDLGRTVIFYCNQTEYRDQIANGTNNTATVRSIEIFITPKHTEKAKENLPLFAIIGGVVGALVLIALVLSYYLCYWRPKRIKEKKRDMDSRIEEVAAISVEKKHKKSGPKDMKDVKPHISQEQLSMDLFMYKVRSPHN